MASVVPPPPLNNDQLRALYPPDLSLLSSQIILRHGERTPVSARFQNAGLAEYWPYCSAAKYLVEAVRKGPDALMQEDASSTAQWDTLRYRRLLETLDGQDKAVLAHGGKDATVESICSCPKADIEISAPSSQPGQLTDRGRATTYALGQRLRHLYVDQLNFLPANLPSSVQSPHATDATVILRTTPIVRALESVQQVFYGLYPPPHRDPAAPVTIVARAISEETLFPNTMGCRRFRELFEAFADRAAQAWNETPEMEYINRKIGKYMTGERVTPRIGVDSHPRLNGIFDSINATRAHGPETRLPSAFYDKRMMSYMDRIQCHEWFDGFRASAEYRRLGAGALLVDITDRALRRAEQVELEDHQQRSQQKTIAVGEQSHHHSGNKEPILDSSARPATMSSTDYPSHSLSGQQPKLYLAGAHDTSLGGFLAALDAFDYDRAEGDRALWPPFTSHVAIELFRRRQGTASAQDIDEGALQPATSSKAGIPARSWWHSIPLVSSIAASAGTSAAPAPHASHASQSAPMSTWLPLRDARQDSTHFVRVRYNDSPVTIPYCAADPARHRPGDPTFCTLEAFRALVASMAPTDWRRECRTNLGKGIIDDNGGTLATGTESESVRPTS